MRSLGWTTKMRAVSLFVSAALSLIVLSACGNDAMGAQNACCIPELASAIGFEQPEDTDDPAQTQDSDGGASLQRDLLPVLQNPSYPNGCELASLATVLQYNGLEVTLEELNETYLPKQDFSLSKRGVLTGPDPEKYYVGDPASEQGWYCFEQPLADAADAFLSDRDSALRACVLSGAGPDELASWLEKDIPVIVWFTVDYDTPVYADDFSWTLKSGRRYIPYRNLHCLVLTAIDDDTCRFADPLSGVAEVDLDTFEEIYTQMGRRALALLPPGER